jgi:hypothetical protein
MIKVIKKIQFGALYIKPAFVFVDQNSGHLKLQFEADASSSVGYLYDNLCKMLGITWNGNSPYNSQGLYTYCSMHSAGDRASYGCGPDNTNAGGFCPQMTLAYAPKFASEDAAAYYISMANDYIDYWRKLYPTGIAVGTEDFCPSKYYMNNGYGAVGGGCLGLFLNRMDLYYVFAPDLSGSWVEFNGMSIAPTYSPAPTYVGGCDDPRNHKLDKCYRLQYSRKSSTMVFWDSLGPIGQLSVMLMTFMATTLFMSIFAARFRKRRRPQESYGSFLWRDCFSGKKKRRRRIRRTTKRSELSDAMIPDSDEDTNEESGTDGTSTDGGTNTDGTSSDGSGSLTGTDTSSVRTSGTGRSGRSRSRSIGANSRRSRGSRYGYRPNQDPKALRSEVLQPHTLADDPHSSMKGSASGDAMSVGSRSALSVRSVRSSRSGRSARSKTTLSETASSAERSPHTQRAVSSSRSRSRGSSGSRSASSRRRHAGESDDAGSATSHLAIDLIGARSTQNHCIQKEEDNYFGGNYV